jgi:D-galactarolactone isomerase
MHIYDHRFPVAPNAKLRPADATVDDYRLLQKRIGTTRNVVVTPSTYGTDNSVTLDAIAKLGAAARGVAVVDASVSDAELKRLDGLGITGIRFNLVQSGATTIEMLEPLSKRVDALGWHVQIHMLGDQILQTQDLLQRLPSRIVFDHLARIPQLAGVDHPAFAFVQKLIDKGRTWVKLSSAYQDSKVGPPTKRRCLEGRAGLCEGRTGANGLGQRLAASDRKDRRQTGRRDPVRPLGRLGAR